MNPRIIALSGPLKGSVFPITEAEFTFGRHPANQAHLEDELVSRRHCSLSLVDGHVHLKDLESMNGTFVNGAQVPAKQLQHGDRVKIGSSKFVFLEGEETEAPAFTEPEEDQFTTRMTLRLDREDALYLAPDKIEKLPSSSRLARDLSTLLRISAAVNAIRNAEKLQARLLELIFEVIPAERAAILLVGHKQADFISGTYREGGLEHGPAFRVSRTISHQVLNDGTAILSNNISGGAFKPTDSLVEGHVHSVLCVPLTVFNSKLGVIYVDSADSLSGFDPDHLQLLTAIAAISAVALEHARYVGWLERENQQLKEEVTGEHGMIGESPLMKEVFRRIGKVAPTNSTVLIGGESGTGKELVAGAIHRLSKRSAGPYVPVNCTIGTESLLEDSLFGHEKGSFTGAVGMQKGKFELADGGTLFLDEVGDMSLSMQANLLRVLEDGEIRRIGSAKTIKVNVRVIAATKRDLKKAIADGAFREDLFFRLNVFPITLPSLRDRREDIPALAYYFLQRNAREMDRSTVGFAPDVMRVLTQADWPGNVRQLRNAIVSALIMTVGDRVLVEDLPEDLGARSGPPEEAGSFKKAHDELTKRLIIDAYRKSQFSYVEAARLLSLHPNYLHRLVRNLQIRDILEDSRGAGS